MKQILIIYKKELRETLRDKRSLFRMVFIPLGLFPLLFGVTNAIQNNATASDMERELRVGFFAAGPDLQLRAALEGTPGFKVYDVPGTDSLKTWIHDGRLDVGVSLSANFASNVNELKTDTVFRYGARASSTVNDRLETELKKFEEGLLTARLQSIHLTRENIRPTVAKFVDTASQRETIGKLAGGFLPYIFILFCYMGCMFPAIDLFTGEKERGSIETLLSAPVDRWKVLIGKMLLIITSGLASAVLSMLGLFLGLKTADSGLGDVVQVALSVLSPVSVIVLVSMLLPLVVFFAGIMIPATVYAKSFKEAATTLQPLNFVVILPAVIGMMPGIELNAFTALIPILNVVLTTKEVIAGTVDWLLFVEVIASLLLIASAAVVFSLKRFGNEKNILRT